MNGNSAFEAAEYDRKIKMTIPFYDEFFNQVLDVVNSYFDRPLRWLDIGCGTGRMAETALAQAQVESFLFLDDSPEMLEIAKIRFQASNTEFRLASVLDLEERGRFDVVTAIQVLHYFHRPERLKIMKKCVRALCPGGIGIFFENFAPYSDAGKKLYLKRWSAYQQAKGKSPEECRTHIGRYGKAYYPVTISEQLDIMKAGGFRNAEVLWVSGMQAGYLGIK